MTENNRFKATYEDGHCVCDKETDLLYHMDNEMITKKMSNLLNGLNDENNQLIKDNFELQGLLGDVRALLRLDKVNDAISRIDKFERSMKK